MIGNYAQWHNNNTIITSAAASAGHHVNQEMWVYTKQNESMWVEVGLRNGIYAENPCNCQAYSVFWAEFDNTGAEHRHYIANTSPNGTNHSYQVSHVCDGCAQWAVYYDGNLKGTSTYQLSGTSYDQQIGQENTSITPATHSDDFDMYAQYQSVDHVWHYWPRQYNVIDRPCGTYATYYCQNGTTYGTSYRWVNNKP